MDTATRTLTQRIPVDGEAAAWDAVSSHTGLTGVALADKVAELVCTGKALTLADSDAVTVSLELTTRGSVLVGTIVIEGK